MSRIWTTIQRELMSYLFSPVGYVIAVLLYLFRGIEVSSIVKGMSFLGGDVDQFASMYVLQRSSLIMIVLVPPILTMRCFAEERRSGSIEVLLTAPVRYWEVVVGKWAAAFLFFCILLLPTLAILWLLAGDSYLSAGVPFSPVFAGYVGLALVGALVLSVGVFTSSLTDNVLLASLSAMLFSWGLISGPALALPHVGPWTLEYPFVETLLIQTNVVDHLSSWFARGLIDSGKCAFYVVGTIVFLFLTTISLEARRWK